MPSYVTPKKNTAFILYCGLVDQADVKKLKTSPTLASGDVKVEIDGGAAANVTTLPTVTPSGASSVKVSLSAAEMNGDNIVVTFADVAGAEWCDLKISIQTTVSQLDECLNSSTTYTELTTVPPATTSLDYMLRWLYIVSRNKITQNSTRQIVFADDETTQVGHSDISDANGITTRGEYS